MCSQAPLESQATDLLERARQRWPKPLSEEALEHWTETQRQTWRAVEQVLIEGDFKTFVQWVRDRDDKHKFAKMYFDCREVARTVRAESYLYARDDLPPEAAEMQAKLTHDLLTVSADFRAEWFRIRWGESIDDYKDASNRTTTGCLSVLLGLFSAVAAGVAIGCLTALT